MASQLWQYSRESLALASTAHRAESWPDAAAGAWARASVPGPEEPKAADMREAWSARRASAARGRLLLELAVAVLVLADQLREDAREPFRRKWRQHDAVGELDLHVLRRALPVVAHAEVEHHLLPRAGGVAEVRVRALEALRVPAHLGGRGLVGGARLLLLFVPVLLSLGGHSKILLERTRVMKKREPGETPPRAPPSVEYGTDGRRDLAIGIGSYHEIFEKDCTYRRPVLRRKRRSPSLGDVRRAMSPTY